MTVSDDFELSPKQEKVLAALISEPSIDRAAKVSGIAVRTVFRCLKRDEAFAAAYRELRSESVKHAVGQIQSAMGSAVQTLVAIMEDPEAPASSRVAAAKTMIETGIRAVEIDELESRISALEKRISKGM